MNRPRLNTPHPWIWPRSVYLHIPFCAHRCGYCDFASVAGFDDLADRYLAALEREIAIHLESPQVVDTIYVGGGTPTRLTAGQLESLVQIIRRWFPLRPGGEWTVEANPGTLDRSKINVLADGGVDRISLGAQTFRPQLLRVLERDHSPASVSQAVELLQLRFHRWSLDLIFGIPGSTLSDCREDVATALKFGPGHLSCYGLVFEKGTRLWDQRRKGLVSAVDEELERGMYELIIDSLEEAGLRMYEISNFAVAGQESQHNLVYWRNDAYFGFGLGAARYVEGSRTVNTRDLAAYLRRVESGRSPAGPSERLGSEGRARETAMLMLRRTVLGIDRTDFRHRTGHDLDELFGDVLARFVDRGLLEDDGSRVRFRREGVFLADTVLRELL